MTNRNRNSYISISDLNSNDPRPRSGTPLLLHWQPDSLPTILIPMKLFHHATLILPDRLLENGAVLSSNGRIEAVGPADLPLHPASTIHHWVIRF